MPRQIEWIHRLDDALTALEAIESPVVDSAAVASLLRVTPRHARRILGLLFDQPAGRGFVLLRSELVERLKVLREDPEHQFELRRRGRVSEELQAVRRDWKARQVPIASLPYCSSGLADLPPGVHLEPGRLEIRFGSPEELLTNLLALAQAMGEDFERFVDSIG
jgi:hypothetical protein